MRPNGCAMRSILVESSRQLFDRMRLRFILVAALLALTAALSIPTISVADETGVSFWLPGFFGSMAATPQQPGWSLGTIYYHTAVSGSGNVGVSREITIGQFNPTLDASVSANVAAKADLGIFAPSYVFATPFFGGRHRPASPAFTAATTRRWTRR
jgi:hypothetical protein